MLRIQSCAGYFTKCFGHRSAMTARVALLRWIRLLWLPALMLGVAVFVLWYGIEILVQPGAGSPDWIGWLLICVGVLKASLWTYVIMLRIRYRARILAPRLGGSRPI
jgi:hypothetical protein